MLSRLATYQEILDAFEVTKRRDGYADPEAAAQLLKDSGLEFGMDFWHASQELACRKKTRVKRRLDHMELGFKLLAGSVVGVFVILCVVKVLNL